MYQLGEGAAGGDGNAREKNIVSTPMLALLGVWLVNNFDTNNVGLYQVHGIINHTGRVVRHQVDTWYPYHVPVVPDLVLLVAVLVLQQRTAICLVSMVPLTVQADLSRNRRGRSGHRLVLTLPERVSMLTLRPTGLSSCHRFLTPILGHYSYEPSAVKDRAKHSSCSNSSTLVFNCFYYDFRVISSGTNTFFGEVPYLLLAGIFLG